MIYASGFKIETTRQGVQLHWCAPPVHFVFAVGAHTEYVIRPFFQVVLVDVLRMSSTIVTAMGQGLCSAELFSSPADVSWSSEGHLPTCERGVAPLAPRTSLPLSFTNLHRDFSIQGIACKAHNEALGCLVSFISSEILV